MVALFVVALVAAYFSCGYLCNFIYVKWRGIRSARRDDDSLFIVLGFFFAPLMLIGLLIAIYVQWQSNRSNQTFFQRFFFVKDK